MGAVELGSQALVSIMEGRPIRDEKALARFVLGDDGTDNQEYMAAGAMLSGRDPALRKAAEIKIDRFLSHEEKNGPRAWEVNAPAPHDGMYTLARAGVMAAPQRDFAKRSTVLLGQELRLGDEIATPDGDLRGLAGMRAANGAGLVRTSLSAVYIEVRRRQPGGEGLIHRGAGGKEQPLKWRSSDDPLIYGAAWWIRQQLDAMGRKDREAVLEGPLSRAAALPARLRLALTIYRWPGFTQSELADPGPDRRRFYIITGSAASKRDQDHDEDVASWVRVQQVAPARHIVTAGESWEKEPPPVPRGAKVIRIAGVDASVAMDAQEPAGAIETPPATDPGPATDGAENEQPALAPPAKKRKKWWQLW